MLYCRLWCSLLTSVEPCWVTQQTQKQISSTLLCIIYCPNTFSSLLSHSTLHIGSHNSVCVCKCCSLLVTQHFRSVCAPFWLLTTVEPCWVTQQTQKQISSTLLCIIYCPNTFSSLLSHSTLHIGSHNSVCVCKCCIEGLVQPFDYCGAVLSDSTNSKADFFHSTMHNLLPKHLF